MTKKKAGPKRTAKKTQRGSYPKAGDGYKGLEIAEVEVMVKTMSVRELGVTLSLEAKLESLDLQVAYDVLVESRLNVVLEVDKHQEELFDDVLPRLENVADCKRISAGISTITWTLSFDAQSVHIDAVQPFLGKQATLWAAKVGVPTKDAGEPADDGQTEAFAEPAK